MEAIDLSAWESVVKQIGKDLHEKKYSPEELSKEAILKTFSELNGAAKAGYGKDWADLGSTKPDDTVLALQKNLYRFSGAKTYAMQLEIQSKMHEGGKLRPYADFEKDVLAINEKYNRNYLQAEYQTARQAAHHARNWKDYQDNKDLFPNLKYKTAGDDRVRKEHERLADIVKPVDDPFWDSYYPPNGWRCRCYVVQTAEPAKGGQVEDPDVKPEFRINVGKEKRAFSEDAPYFALAKAAGGDVLKRAVELSKQYAPLHTAYKAKGGGVVKVSPFKDDQDFFGNYRAAVKMADKGYEVEVRAHINNVKGYDNPEYRINGTVADRKAVEGIKGVKTAIDRAKKQMYDRPYNTAPKPYSIVIDFVNLKQVDWDFLKSELNRKITYQRGQHIESIFLIYKNEVVEMTRMEIVKRDYTKLDKIQ